MMAGWLAGWPDQRPDSITIIVKVELGGGDGGDGGAGGNGVCGGYPAYGADDGVTLTNIGHRIWPK